MLLRILVSWAILGVALFVAAEVVPGMAVSGGFWGVVWLAALYGLVNAVIGTVLKLLTLPLTILTLGLFAILVNVFLLWLTAGLADWLQLSGFWNYVLAAIVISIVSMALNWLLRPRAVVTGRSTG